MINIGFTIPLRPPRRVYDSFFRLSLDFNHCLHIVVCGASTKGK